MTEQPNDTHVARLGEIEAHLKSSISSYDLSHFSAEAIGALEARLGDYVGDVLNGATRLAQRQTMDSVSAAHVNQANATLVARSSSGFLQFLGNSGGVLLGAALSNLPGILDGTASSLTIVGSFVMTALGAGLMIWQAAKA